MDERQALSENTRRDLLSPGVSEIMGGLKGRKARNPTPKDCSQPGGQWDDLSVDFSQSVTTNMDDLGVNCSNVGNMQNIPLYAVVEEYLASNRLRSMIEGPDDEDESDEDNEVDSSHCGSSFSLDDGSSTSSGILDSIYTPTSKGKGRTMNRIIEKLSSPAAKRDEVNDDHSSDSTKAERVAENSEVKSDSGLKKRRWHSMFAKTRAKVKSDLEKNALGADESKLTEAVDEKSAQTPLGKHLDSMFGVVSSHATDDITLNTLQPETSEEDVKDFIRPLILEEETEIVFDKADDHNSSIDDDKLWGNPKIWDTPAAASRFNSTKKRSGSLANALKAGRERRSTGRGPKDEACSIPVPTKHESDMDILMASGGAVVVGSPKNVRLDTLEKRQRSILELLSLPSEESGSQLDSSSANKEYQKLKVKLRSIQEILSSPQGSGSLDPRSKRPSIANDAPVGEEPQTKVAPPQSSGSRKERIEPSVTKRDHSLQSKDSGIRAVAIEDTNILGSLVAAAKKKAQKPADVSSAVKQRASSKSLAETCSIESTTRRVLPGNSVKARSEIDRRPKQNMPHAKPKGLRARLSKRKGGTTRQTEDSASSHVQISCGTGIEVESGLPTSSAGEALLTESKEYKPSGRISSIDDIHQGRHNDNSKKTIRRKEKPKKSSNVVVAHRVRQSDSNSKSIKVEAAGSTGIELSACEDVHEGRGNARKQKSQHKLSSLARMMAPAERKPAALKFVLQKPQRPIASNHRSVSAPKLRTDPALSIERQDDYRVRTIATPHRNPDTLELELGDPGQHVAPKHHNFSASKLRNDSSISIEKQGDLRVRAIAPSDSNPDALELELGVPRRPIDSNPRCAIVSKNRVGSVQKKEEACAPSKTAVSTAEQSKEMVVPIASEKGSNTAIPCRGIVEEPHTSTATPMRSLKPAIKSSGNNKITPGMKVHFAASIAGKDKNAAPTARAGGRNSKSGQSTQSKHPKRRPLTPTPLDSTADATFVEKAMQQMNFLGGQSAAEKQESSSGKAPLSIYRFLDFNPCHSALVDSPKTKQLSSGVKISGLCSADNTESNIGRSAPEPMRDAREDQSATKEMCTNRDSVQEVQFSPTKNNVSHLLQCNANASFVEKTVQPMNSLQSETDSDSGIADLRDENSPVSSNRFFDFGQCGESLANQSTHEGKTGTSESHPSKSQLTRRKIDCSTDTPAANGPETNIAPDIAAQTASQARVVPTLHNDTLFCSTGGSTLNQTPKDSAYPERVQSGGVISTPGPKKTPLSDNRSSTSGPLKPAASTNPNHGKKEEEVHEQSIEYQYSVDPVLDPERRHGQIVGDTSSDTQRDNSSTPLSIIGKMKLALQKKNKSRRSMDTISMPSSKEAVSLPSETSENREIQDPAPSIASSAVTSIEKLSMIRAEYEKALAEVTGGDSMPGAPVDEKSGASSIRLSEIRADFKRARKYLDHKESVSERALSAAEKEVARRLANDLMILSKIERKRTKIRQKGAEGKVKVLEKTLELVESIKNRRSNEEESYCLDDSSSDNIDDESHPDTPNALFTLLASDSETTAADTPTTQYSGAGVFDWLFSPEGSAK